MLAGGTAAVAVEAELVSGALEATATQLGLSTFFLGVTVLAVVGNAAEYTAAVYYARKDQMGMVMSITAGSTIQVTLLVAPLLVVISFFLGHPMDLIFANPLELIAIAGVAFAINAIAQDGQTTWFECLLLVVLYVLFGPAFFCHTERDLILAEEPIGKSQASSALPHAQFVKRVVAVLSGVVRHGRYFNRYTVTNGSIGAVIVLLMWLHLSAIAFLVGGEVNSELKKPPNSQSNHKWRWKRHPDPLRTNSLTGFAPL